MRCFHILSEMSYVRTPYFDTNTSVSLYCFSHIMTLLHSHNMDTSLLLLPSLSPHLFFLYSTIFSLLFQQFCDITNDGEYTDLQAALDAYGVTEKLAPKWVPDGFTLDLVSVDEGSEGVKVIFCACYKSGEKSLIVQINMHQSPSDASYATWQKDDMDVDTVRIADCTFYTMQNAGRECAIWTKGPFECNINGNISSDEMHKVIESIFE